MGRIAVFAEKIVPFMAGFYIVGSLLVVLINIGDFLPAIKSIFLGAFKPSAIGGGALGITIQQTIRFGLARGLFSNEAGMGSTPHSHAVADVGHPAEQGFTAMIGVFISTFLICLSTVMVNLTSGAYNPNISAAEMSQSATIMTQSGFAIGFGTFGGIFLSICLTFFSLTTIVGWYFFAESNVKYVFNSHPITIAGFKVLVVVALILGTMIDAGFAWELADMFMGIMALPNIIALFLLSKEVVAMLNDYDTCVKRGRIYWDYQYQNIASETANRGRKLGRELGTTTIK